MHARYYRNPFRRSLTVDTKEDVNNAGAEGAPSDIDILLRNLVVGPPKGAERIMLKVSSDNDGTSDEIAAITKEREDQIKRGNQNQSQNDENPKTERVINVVESFDFGNDSNQQKGSEAGNASSNAKVDGRQSNEPNKADSDTNNNKAATSENNNKTKDSPKSDGNTAKSGTANKPTANNPKSPENSNAGETNANATNNIKKNTVNNANAANANNAPNDNKQQQQQQQQKGNSGSEGNAVAINKPAAESSGSDNRSNEGQNANGKSASVGRSTRNTKKSEGNNGRKLISGYVVIISIYPAGNLNN